MGGRRGHAGQAHGRWLTQRPSGLESTPPTREWWRRKTSNGPPGVDARTYGRNPLNCGLPESAPLRGRVPGRAGSTSGTASWLLRGSPDLSPRVGRRQPPRKREARKGAVRHARAAPGLPSSRSIWHVDERVPRPASFGSWTRVWSQPTATACSSPSPRSGSGHTVTAALSTGCWTTTTRAAGAASPTRPSSLHQIQRVLQARARFADRRQAHRQDRLRLEMPGPQRERPLVLGLPGVPVDRPQQHSHRPRRRLQQPVLLAMLGVAADRPEARSSR